MQSGENELRGRRCLKVWPGRPYPRRALFRERDRSRTVPVCWVRWKPVNASHPLDCADGPGLAHATLLIDDTKERVGL